MTLTADLPTAGGAARRDGPHLSVVVPVYNEEATLEALYARLAPRPGGDRPIVRSDLRERRQPGCVA